MLIIPAGLVPGGWESTFSPTTKDGIAVAASSTVHTKGSYVQLIASTAKQAYGLIIKGNGTSVSSTDTACLCDIAIGAASSEIDIIPNLNFYGAPGQDSGPGGHTYFVPIYIPSGSRISARVQSVISSDVLDVDVWPLFAGAGIPTQAGPVNAYGVNLSASRGKSIAVGVDAYGSWVEMVASTLRDHRFWFFGYGPDGDTSISTGTLPHGFELGVGAAASEVVVARDMFMGFQSNETGGVPSPNLLHAPIPSGSRIAVRCFTDIGSDARDVIAYGVS